MRYERVRGLFGDNFSKIQKAKILLLGVGGVGGFCLDALYRSGVTDITIVDFDTFDISNQNRQIGSEAIGEIKVEALHKLYPTTHPIHEKITPTWVEEFDFEPFDIVIDAIDDMSAKVAIAHKCHAKLISSTGSARKVDPTLIRSDSIWKTTGDKLAKKFRYELKKSGFEGDFECVYSHEEQKCEGLSSLVCVTGAFGLAIASCAITKIIRN